MTRARRLVRRHRLAKVRGKPYRPVLRRHQAHCPTGTLDDVTSGRMYLVPLLRHRNHEGRFHLELLVTAHALTSRPPHPTTGPATASADAENTGEIQGRSVGTRGGRPVQCTTSHAPRSAYALAQTRPVSDNMRYVSLRISLTRLTLSLYRPSAHGSATRYAATASTHMFRLARGAICKLLPCATVRPRRRPQRYLLPHAQYLRAGCCS